MKKIILLSCLLLLGLSAWAQTITNLTVITYQTNRVTLFETNHVFAVDTNPAPPVIGGPAASWLAFLGSGSNWMLAPYFTIAEESKKIGGGIAVGYLLSPNIVTVMRFDEFDRRAYMPSLSIQLQAPVKLFQAATLIPFGFVGAASPISGAGDKNGAPVAILGIGGALRLDFIKSTGFFSKLDLVYSHELWEGLESKDVKQDRVGILYRF
jgi:hypothetical protein